MELIVVAIFVGVGILGWFIRLKLNEADRAKNASGMQNADIVRYQGHIGSAHSSSEMVASLTVRDVSDEGLTWQNRFYGRAFPQYRIRHRDGNGAVREQDIFASRDAATLYADKRAAATQTTSTFYIHKE